MDRKIFILAPPNGVSGGPELLHQLGYKLNLLGFKAYMVYAGGDSIGYSTPEPYSRYHVPVCEEIEDVKDNIVIFPELFLFALNNIKSAKRVLWWLSVDNAIGNEKDYKYAFSQKDIIHLSQSEYAIEFIVQNGIDRNRIYWLSDYINSDFLHLGNVPDEDKNDIVVYNPKKGIEKTEELIREAGDRIKWLPLEGFTPLGMRKVLQNSKVYIDFGNHPGRDRIPREATFCGCLLLTNKSGSAANEIDIPIEESYKIEHNTNAMEVVDRILYLINNYSLEKQKLASYVHRTSEEFRTFETDTLSVFEKITETDAVICDANGLKTKMLKYINMEEYEKAFYYMVKYRQLSFEEDLEYLIIEATIRQELNELNEAEYIARKALKNNSNNYELVLMLAKIHLKMKTIDSIVESLSECKKAIEFSKDSEDEEIVVTIATSYMEEIKTLLN